MDPLADYNPFYNSEHYIDGEHNGGIYNSGNNNPFIYCYQSPIRYVDPNGKQVDITGSEAQKLSEIVTIRGKKYHKNTTNLPAIIGNKVNSWFGGDNDYFIEHKSYDFVLDNELFRNNTESIVEIIIGNLKIQCTPKHPFYVSGTWINAEDLKEGDHITSINGSLFKIDQINIINSSLNVYNFEVKNNHNYYVSKNQLLAHNLCFNGKFGKAFLYRAHSTATKALDHIWLRHGFNTTFGGVSKFSPNLSKLEIKELIINSIKNANSQTDLIIKPNGYMDILYDTGKVIGRDINGNPTSK